MFPVFGKIKGGSSVIKSFFKKKRKISGYYWNGKRLIILYENER